MLEMEKVFQVGVFEHPGKRGPRYAAYTVWYNRSWEGLCEHYVKAENGGSAKKRAIEDHKNKRFCNPGGQP